MMNLVVEGYVGNLLIMKSVCENLLGSLVWGNTAEQHLMLWGFILAVCMFCFVLMYYNFRCLRAWITILTQEVEATMSIPVWDCEVFAYSTVDHSLLVTKMSHVLACCCTSWSLRGTVVIIPSQITCPSTRVCEYCRYDTQVCHMQTVLIILNSDLEKL